MDEYGFNMNVLRKFLDTTRTYLELARKPATPAQRRPTWRFSVTGMAVRPAIDYRENAPA